MTADVGILVENYEIVSAAMKDQVFRVSSGVLLRVTEDAGDLRSVGFGLINVFVSPGTPQSFHDVTYRSAKELTELTTGFR